MHDPFSVIAEYYDEITQKVDYREWSAYIKSLFSMAPLKPIKKVLDLAIGTGNIASYLKSAGYEVSGLDFSIGMLRVAKRKNAAHHLIRADFRELPFKDSTFDGVYSTFDSLNNILDPQELLNTFKEVRRILRKGGPFVFDLNTKWSLEFEWDNNTRVEETQNTISIWKSRYIDQISYLYFTLFVRENKEANLYKKVSTVFRERGYDPQEVKNFLKRANFEKVYSFEHFTFTAGKAKSSRITYLAY